MNRKILIFFLFTIILLSFISATSRPEAPLCNVSATILAISEFDAWENPCVKECNSGLCCPTDVRLSHPAGYTLLIEVKNVTYISGDTNYFTCEDYFKIGQTVEVKLYENNIKSGDDFRSNQQIELLTTTYRDEIKDYSLLDSEIQSPEEKKFNFFQNILRWFKNLFS